MTRTASSLTPAGSAPRGASPSSGRASSEPARPLPPLPSDTRADLAAAAREEWQAEDEAHYIDEQTHYDRYGW